MAWRVLRTVQGRCSDRWSGVEGGGWRVESSYQSQYRASMSVARVCSKQKLEARELAVRALEAASYSYHCG